MKIRCLSVEASQLGEPFFEAGFTPRSSLHVTAKQIYVVVGIGVVAGVVCYLVRDDSAMPNWVPAPLFEVTQTAVGSDWAFMYFHRGKRLPGVIDALFANREIADDPQLLHDIMDRNPDALSAFSRILAGEDSD